MTQKAKSLEKLPSTTRDDLAIMDKLANALERLSKAQPTMKPRATFKATDFIGDGDVKYFIQQFRKWQMLSNGQRLLCYSTFVLICKVVHMDVKIILPWR